MEHKEVLLRNLKKRGFDAYYFEDKESCVKFALEMIPKDATCGWGGSETIGEIGIKDELLKRGNPLYDRGTAKDPAEFNQKMMDALTSDYFLMSSNALTIDGELFNIDGNGNRLAALMFGPKNVIVFVGKNKVCKDLDEAYTRVRQYVAPKNAKRLNLKTPCTISGKCQDCQSADCICSQLVTTRRSRQVNRIKIFIINEELGY